jgi:hypothetical protein
MLSPSIPPERQAETTEQLTELLMEAEGARSRVTDAPDSGPDVPELGAERAPATAEPRGRAGLHGPMAIGLVRFWDAPPSATSRRPRRAFANRLG